MITLVELINATTWLEPQDHIKIVLWDKSKVYEDTGEFTSIDFNIRNLAKYGNYWVSDIDIEDGKLTCLIWKD
jgi:hypothetical protein